MNILKKALNGYFCKPENDSNHKEIFGDIKFTEI